MEGTRAWRGHGHGRDMGMELNRTLAEQNRYLSHCIKAIRR